MKLVTGGEQKRGDSDRHGVYESVKARIIANELPSGKRVLVEPLADRLFVSNTPVREALIRLAAERVIDEVPKAGFFVKEFSEAEIAGLYTLQQLLLRWSLSTIRDDGRTPGLLKPPNLPGDLHDALEQEGEIPSSLAVDVMDKLTVHIARQSGNADVMHIIQNINDRTRFVRAKDHEMFGDAEQEILHLCQAYYHGDFDRLRGALKAWLRKKALRLPELLRFIRGSMLRTSA